MFIILSLLISTLPLFALRIENNNIVDQMGNKISLKKYERVIVIDSAVVEIIYLIGGEENIVAIANTMNGDIWPMEKTNKLSTVGTITKPSIEHVLSYEPDLIILNPMIAGFENLLQERKIPYIINNGNNFKEILNKLK
jgi:iron complex transport system substrate-binding protein